MEKVNIFDVCKCILEITGEITAMKLQKLAYYVKAWGLVWHEEEIFPENFQAWINGAVCYDLYKVHQGMFKVDSSLFGDADIKKIPKDQQDTIKKVVNFYNKYTAQQLSDINHQEIPWIKTREGCKADERCYKYIYPALMHEYYSGLLKK